MLIHRDRRGLSAELAPGLYWSKSHRNVLRGLHYRTTHRQIMTVINGTVFDVVVDIESRKWVAQYLAVGQQVIIPEGYAHGFCVLSESADLIYQMSEPYDANQERSIAWNDPTLAIAWPIKNPILSDRDANAKNL